MAYESSDNLWPGADSMTIEPFRCAGRLVKQGEFIPRMHNKFLVFCDKDEEGNYHPIEVWTGSYNMSKTATLGFENGVGIISTEIGKAYLSEFSDILLLSEPLDWHSEWIAPQLAIGIS
ncbi:hypothetical protein ASD52_09685 [Ensifer sp. Root142]|nr:hypothetical protein ASD52_09685 [Ensifer sp. Root142]